MINKNLSNILILIQRHWFDSLLLLVFMVTFQILATADKLEFLPTTFFSAATAYFSNRAYNFAKEKFRLDLFEKRWEVYENTLKFCSKVMQEGTLRANENNNEQILQALLAAQESFRGIGWHKSRALFGQDIQELFSGLNASYAWLLAHAQPLADPAQREQWASDEA